MNANELADELADELEEHSQGPNLTQLGAAWFLEIATMLRQQQAEIEALKRPNNVVGMPQDKLAGMQATIRQQQEQLNTCRESKKEDLAEIYSLKAEIESLKEKKISLSYADLEARLDWSRHEGSGASYLEGFEDGALWAEQEIRKAQK